MKYYKIVKFLKNNLLTYFEKSANIVGVLKKYFALVAQLDRVFGYEPKGQGFESLRAHHISGNGSTW